jgi:hypothetical protein
VRRVPRVLAVVIAPGVLSGIAIAGADAQDTLPPCEPSKNGALIAPEVTDPEQRSGSRALYATHRLRLKLFADNEAEDPDGTRYQTLPGSERLAPAPGVVGRRAFIGASPGPVGLAVIWTVTRGPFGGPYDPFCTGSETIPVTLRRPTRTSLSAERVLGDYTGDTPRVKLAIGGRASDDLRPVTVRMRRGARGGTRELFTLPLAHVTAGSERYRFRERFAGTTIRSARGDARFDGRALVTVGVSVPKVRAGRRLRRSFTLEAVREGDVLMRVRAVIACRGIFARGIPPFQVCDAPVWRVTRP